MANGSNSISSSSGDSGGGNHSKGSMACLSEWSNNDINGHSNSDTIAGANNNRWVARGACGA